MRSIKQCLNVYQTNGQRILMIGHIACRAMISFATYTEQQTSSAFQWAKQPPKLPPWAHNVATRNGSLITTAIFAQYITVTNRQMDRSRDHNV